jgi:methylmalonyl-CoA mutase
LIKSASSLFPKLRTLGINGSIFHNAGGNIVQELGFSLAIISDYLDLLTKEGLKPGLVAKSMQLNMATGPLYFMEIAKLRAARLLFARLVSYWGVEDEDSLKAFIHCTSSEWNQTIFEPYVNLLRTTTESMSAVLGGCDSLTVSPFDKAFRETTKFSERIARNTQIILKEEAWLDKVADPAAGAYFIENLTDSIITESWRLFLEIEEMGGYLASFKAGEIQKRIGSSASLRDQNIAGRKEILLGTNQYPNLLEIIPEDMDLAIAFPLKTKQTYLVAEPLQLYRGSEAFEKLRLVSEGKNQKVFLLTIGNPVWRKARAGFALNFFGCAGFEIIDIPGFDTLDSGISAAKASRASIIVLCSSDEEYVALAPEALKKLDKKTILVVAGFPKDCIDELKAKGIQNFIHMKSNVLEELSKYQEMLGK